MSYFISKAAKMQLSHLADFLNRPLAETVHEVASLNYTRLDHTGGKAPSRSEELRLAIDDRNVRRLAQFAERLALPQELAHAHQPAALALDMILRGVLVPVDHTIEGGSFSVGLARLEDALIDRRRRPTEGFPQGSDHRVTAQFYLSLRAAQGIREMSNAFGVARRGSRRLASRIERILHQDGELVLVREPQQFPRFGRMLTLHVWAIEKLATAAMRAHLKVRPGDRRAVPLAAAAIEALGTGSLAFRRIAPTLDELTAREQEPEPELVEADFAELELRTAGRGAE